MVGRGAGYDVPDKLYEAVDVDANYIFNVDPVSIWLIDPEALAPGLGEMTEMVGEEYKKKPDRILRHSPLMLGWPLVTVSYFLMMFCQEPLKSMVVLALKHSAKQLQKQTSQWAGH